MNTWRDVEQFLRTKGYHAKLTVEKPFQDPLRAGFYVSTGMPAGQIKDYRLQLEDGKGLHVREYATTYQAHIDEVDPRTSVVAHMFADVPCVSVPLAMIFLRKV